jgi:sorbitol-specific phosphotransferase system component IIA
VEYNQLMVMTRKGTLAVAKRSKINQNDLGHVSIVLRQKVLASNAGHVLVQWYALHKKFREKETVD